MRGNQYQLLPGLEPAKTPKLGNHGPAPSCTCDLPNCTRCRARATGRRWYQRNKIKVYERTKARMPEYRARRKQVAEQVSDEDLDRRCFEMLRQEGLR